MIRSGNRQNRPSLPSLVLIAGSLACACSGKVQMGVATGDGTLPTTFQKLEKNNITSVDLLLMIDNSAGMADKQAILAAAVPQLIGKLVQPACVDPTSGAYISPSTLGAAAPCASGTPEFNPVNNIHIGVVTSSLGDHGANSICTPGALTNYTDANGMQIAEPPDVNDLGHLVGTLDRAAAARNDPQTTYATINGLGFLAWGDATLPTPGAADLTAATKMLTDLVAATHEVGCGFESQLESWFRFLIDPVPPVLPVAPPVDNMTHRQGSDDTLLNQRAAFLRPDSLVAIVMLTDENDCSIRDSDVGWVSAMGNSITTGSAACKSNPNDKCCYSCTSLPPSGCTSGCASDSPAAVNDGPYQANIRCWNQKRRFGYEFLYPKSRYVVGLTKPELCPDQDFGDMDCDCEYAKSIGASCSPGARRMPNPLYSTIAGTLNDGSKIVSYPNAAARSDNSGIYLMGIVGVPWQDIGTLDASGSLKYIPTTDPAYTTGPVDASDTPVNPPSNGAAGIWDMIYGDDNANIAPKDVHMVESLTPRNGLPGPTAAAGADPFNGHEYNTALEDFEYACTFQLPTPRPCKCESSSATYASCKYQNPNSCCDLSFKTDGAGGPGGDFDNPVCNSNTQVAAKAYPGLREVAVLKDYATSPNAATKGNSVVASICPANLSSDTSNPGYGYNPAVSALVDRLKEKLKGSCYPNTLRVHADGSVPCFVEEAVPPSALSGAGSCEYFCTSQQRQMANASVTADVTAAMQNAHICGTTGGVPCADMCICQLPQESSFSQTDLSTCQNAPDGASVTALPPGFCYVDPTNGAGTNPDIVGRCPATQQRIIRFVGNNPSLGIAVPLAGSYVFLSCSAKYN